MTLPKITPAIFAAWKAAPRCPHCNRKAGTEDDNGLSTAYICASDFPRSALCDAWRQEIKTDDMIGPARSTGPTAGELAARGKLGANIITTRERR